MADFLISQFQREYNGPIETFRQVADIAARDAISALRRWEGMVVYVLTEGETFVLKGGVTNTNWVIMEGLSDAPADGGTYGRRNGAWQIISSSGLPYTLFEATITAGVVPTIIVHFDSTDGFTLSRAGVGQYVLTPVGVYDQAAATLFANPVQVGTLEDELVKLQKTATECVVAFFKNGSLSDDGNRIDVSIKLF
jgi:hypothetical protein